MVRSGSGARCVRVRRADVWEYLACEEGGDAGKWDEVGESAMRGGVKI